MKFDYGRDGLEILIKPEWNVTIFRAIKQQIIEKPVEVIRDSIKNPFGSPQLKKIIESKNYINKVCIVVDDATRPVPSQIILEALIKELKAYGIKEKQIFVLIATGSHRCSREDELIRIMGMKLRNKIEVIDHIASDKNALVYLGETSDGNPIYINKHYYESEIKILTGYVEPHFFLGFSGGRKSLGIGIAGEETIIGNHSPDNISSPYSRFGIYKENPMHKISNEISKLVGADFIINVCINEEHKITQVASGDLEKVHEFLVNYQLKNVFKDFFELFDIVICGNGGYPLDLNLYQAVKSMAIGELAVKNNGTIITVNELSEGVGLDNFKELIFSGKTPHKIYEQILSKEISVPDQWEIQILARVLMKAEIYVVSKLKKEEIGNIGLKYAKSVEKAIDISLKKHGKNAKILILPHGPQVIPLKI